jgi:thiol-disulfide isomerase/thioredoxin
MNCPYCNQSIPDNNYRCPDCGKILKEGREPRDFIPKPVKKQGLNLTYFVLMVIVVGLAVMTYFIFQKEDEKGTDHTNTNINKSYQPKREAKLNIGKTPVDGETQEESDDPWEDTDQEQDSEEPDIPEENESKAEEKKEPEDPLARIKKESVEKSIFSNEPEAEKKEEPEDPYAWVEKVEKERKKKSILSHQPGEEIEIKNLVQEGKTTIFDFYSVYCGPCRRISPLLERLDRRRDDIVVIKIDINRNGVRGIDWGSPVTRQYNIQSIPYFIIYDTRGRRVLEGKEASRQVFQLLRQEGVR